MPPRTPLSRLLLIGLAVSLAACQTRFTEDWSDVPDTKEVEVDVVHYAHSVRFAGDSTHLDGDERDRLDAFLAKVQAGPGDTVVVGAEAADAAIAGRRRDTVTAYLAHRGVEPRPAGDALGAEIGGPDSVTVVIERHTVTLPPCPDWSDRPGRTWNNTVSRNWGCATAANLGLMVADPGDLLVGRRPGPTDGDFAVKAIQRYRAGETTPLTPEDVGTTQKQQKASSGGSGAAE